MTQDNAPLQSPKFAKRPSGFVLTLAGFILMCLGGGGLIIGLLLPEMTRDPYSSEMLRSQEKWPLIYVGCAAVTIGFYIWTVGRIIRAIYFLPGRDVIDEWTENR